MCIRDSIEVIDYIPSGLSLDDADWTVGADGNPTILVPGPVAPGASTSVDITTTVVDGSDLTNLAEIAAADPVEADGVTLVLANGAVLTDIDSVPDATNTENPVDDEIAGAGGDEDDHDLAAVTLAFTETPVTPATPPLAVTGTTWTMIFFSWAFGLLFLGAALMLFARKPEELVAVVEERRQRRS